MSKIYLVGMTQDQKKNIKVLTDPIYKYIDGLIFVDHGSTDGTRELLEERKGCGKIIEKKWCRSNDHSMSSILLEGCAEQGDFLIFRDSLERFNPDWAKNIRQFCDSLRMQGIRTCYNYGKIFLWQFCDSQYFIGSPHFGLEGAQGKFIDLKNYFSEEKKEHTWRIKDGEEGGRPIDNKIDHEAKYAWVYGRSNHLLLGYENRLDEYQRAEMIRIHIRDVAQQKGFDFTIQGLVDFMNWLEMEDKENFRAWINSHRVWKNFYRRRLMFEDFHEIEKTENEWILE